MVQASVGGHLDYTTLDPQDLNDLIREMLVLRTVESNMFKDLLNSKVQMGTLNALYVLLGALGRIEYGTASKECSELFHEINKLSLPWMDWDTVAKKAAGSSQHIPDSVVAGLKERWEAIYGKMDSPEVQEKLKAFGKEKAAAKVVRGNTVIPKGAKWIMR